jgi:hypothetical protein
VLKSADDPTAPLSNPFGRNLNHEVVPVGNGGKRRIEMAKIIMSSGRTYWIVNNIVFATRKEALEYFEGR